MILVLGAEGMLGKTLCPGLSALGYRVLRQSRRSGADICLDPLDAVALAAAISSYRPDAVVNLIAESNVDACQADMRRAYLGNVRVVEKIISALAMVGSAAHFVQISTDHLYDGLGPHHETATLPINAYAMTKYAGEMVAMRGGATVLRTNFFGRSSAPSRRSFSDWVVDSLKQHEKITVFDDVRFSAIHMKTLTNCVAEAIRQRHAGVFNVGCKDGISKALFAQKLATGLGLDQSTMRIGTVKDVSLAAPRPDDMTMDVAEFESRFSVNLPFMEVEIALTVKDYQEMPC